MCKAARMGHGGPPPDPVDLWDSSGDWILRRDPGRVRYSLLKISHTLTISRSDSFKPDRFR